MRRIAAILGAVVVAVAACTQAPAGQEQQTPAASEQPVRGGRIVEASISDIKTLQPVISQDSASSGAHGLIYLGLLRNNKDSGELEGSLAEKFEVSPDGKTVTYTLRPNLAWSDGVPFTMDDYKYTVEAVARSKKSQDRSAFKDVVGWQDYVDGKADGVAGVTVKNNGQVLEIKTNSANCVAARNFAQAGRGIIPKHSFLSGWENKTTDATKNADDHPLNLKPPASMGPFVFKEWQPGVQVTFTSNEKYFRGRPNIDEYIIKVYADQAAIKAALLTGEVSFGSIQPADIEEVQNKGKDALVFYRNKGVAGYNYLGWNQKAAKAPWLADKRVRQALWYGIDVKSIVDKVVLGYGHQVYAHIPQANAFYDETGLNKYPYDVSKAKQLLEQAGATMGSDGVYRWTNGQPMQMRIETNQGNNVRETIVQIAQEQYKKIGIKIDPLLEAFPALVDRSNCCNADLEGYVLGWGLGLDPDSAMMGIWHSQNAVKDGFNGAQYVNPELDKAAEAGRFGPDCSVAARKVQYTKIQKLLNDDAPYTFLYTGDALVFVNKSIQSFKPTAFSTASAWNIHEWWIKK